MLFAFFQFPFCLAQEWIESVIGSKFPAGQSYEDTLKDGVVCCKLINKIKPGSVAKINEGGATFKLMENVQNFQKALREYGVPDIDVFQTVDLFEKKDISQVTNTFFALGRAVWKDTNWTGPKLGPKPADLNEREFTEDQLKAGQTIIGLQAGQNKGKYHFCEIAPNRKCAEPLLLPNYLCFWFLVVVSSQFRCHSSGSKYWRWTQNFAWQINVSLKSFCIVTCNQVQ